LYVFDESTRILSAKELVEYAKHVQKLEELHCVFHHHEEIHQRAAELGITPAMLMEDNQDEKESSNLSMLNQLLNFKQLANGSKQLLLQPATRFNK